MKLEKDGSLRLSRAEVLQLLDILRGGNSKYVRWFLTDLIVAMMREQA